MTRPGHLFILSGPSGSGKTTLKQAVLEQFPDMRYSVSATTRPPRQGEKHGRDYYFISEAAFQTGIASGEWLEWARVHGHYYGTSAAFIQRELAQGRDVLLDIDVQGTRQVLKRLSRCIPVFIMPPSLDVLRTRLEKRSSETQASLQRRLEDARREIRQLQYYRHVVVNDRLEEAVSNLADLIRGYRTRCETACPPNDSSGSSGNQR
jgi:guanylate kinase